MAISRRQFMAAGAALAGTAAIAGLSGCGADSSSTDGDSTKADSGKLYVYNWGEYIDEDVVSLFEEETGIEVVYDTFETNEIMYPIIEQGQTVYDVVCPSDYMIDKMRKNGLLAEIDFDNIPNYKNIAAAQIETSKQFDPENKFSVPYTWGTMGILYDTKRVVEPPTSWDVLWDEQYKGEILMQKSVRDLLAVGLKKLGYSLNTTDADQIAEARDLLIEQKPLVQAYVIDQVRDKMIGGEAILGCIYSGEYLYCKEENPDLAYVVPDEGSNVWVDSWVIPANAENKANAEKWIDFMCRPDIALKNFEYIWYATPNTEALKEIEPEIAEDPGVFPDQELIDRCEVFNSLDADVEKLYTDAYNQILAAD